MGKTLSTLTNDDLQEFPAWVAVGDYAEDIDAQLAPVEFDAEGRVPSDLEEVWCLCTAVFADGSEHLASAMCRGDSDVGPILFTVWNRSDDVSLYLPPAPPFVLAKHGPEILASHFGKTLENVFPLTIRVEVRFATPPEERKVRLGVKGIM